MEVHEIPSESHKCTVPQHRPNPYTPNTNIFKPPPTKLNHDHRLRRIRIQMRS